MKDFILNNNYELQIENGDFKIADSSNQDCKLICVYAPGHLKSDPKLGVGIERMILSSNNIRMKQLLIRELKNDGYTLKDFSFDLEGNLNINI